MASGGNHPFCLHLRNEIQIVEALDVLPAAKRLGQHMGYLVIGGGTKDSIDFRNLIDDLLFVALSQAAGNDQRFTLTHFLHLRHLEDCVNALLLGVTDEAACVDDNDIRLVLVIRKGIAVLV